MLWSKSWNAFLDELGGISRFASRFASQVFKPRYEFAEFLKQCYLIGNLSFPLVGLTSFIMGLVLTMQLRPTMVDYGVEAQIPAMVAVAVIRELGPVIIALIFAGKIGSSIGAELGSMRVTEQIDAMEVSGTNPFKYLVVTRVLATTLMLPVLVIIGDTIMLLGSFIGVNLYTPNSFTMFIRQAMDSLTLEEFIPAFIKTFFFGFAIGIIGCYKGFNTSRGTEGVGRSANSAVVVSSVWIFILDLIAVQITDFLGYNG
jgi:phospholipid/cholesterol/gamma-HCH transport system permease protein